jgi:cell division protein FtsW
MIISRTDTSRLAVWWYSVDRTLLGALLALAAAGIVISMAASPAVALRRGMAPFALAERHVLFTGLACTAMMFVSLFTAGQIRRVALGVLIVAFAALAAVLVIGPEVNGARRWLRVGGHSIQPSEFAKPAFIVMSAWLLAETQRRQGMPAIWLAIGLYSIMVALLLAEPDVGQTLLISLVWGAMFLLSGLPLIGALAFLLVGLVGGGVAYVIFPHVRVRLDKFLSPGSSDTFQTDRALQSFLEGGFFGRGPGEGTIKNVLPDAHTDFIFAVVAEEYGIVACIALAGLIAFIVFRALLAVVEEKDLFIRLAVSGLALLIAFQTLINMGVNVGLLPAKGMTLPFISNGGSSMIAVGFGAGLMLGLLRASQTSMRRSSQLFLPESFPDSSADTSEESLSDTVSANLHSALAPRRPGLHHS